MNNNNNKSEKKNKTKTKIFKWKIIFKDGTEEKFYNIPEIAKRLNYKVNSIYDFNRKKKNKTQTKLLRFPDIKIQKIKPFCPKYRKYKKKKKNKAEICGAVK